MKYFDGHCDTISEMARQGAPLRKNSLHIDLARTAVYESYAQFFAVWAEYRECADGLYEKRRALFLRELEKNSDIVSFCRNYKEAQSAEKEGKRAAFFSVEGTELLGCSVERLREAHRDGVRMAALTWNYSNAVSGSCAEEPEKGLTTQGKEFVRACEKLGVIVDVSHLSPAGFDDLAAMAEKPFIASHSDSAAVFAHARGATDKQIRAIAESGGTVGINLYTDFLGDKSTDAILRHLDRIISVGGEGCPAMGGDLDGCDSIPAGMNGVEDVAKIYDSVIKYGFGKELADRIFWGNLMEVVKKICVT